MAGPNQPPTINNPKKCGHPQCACLITGASSYCSESCERQHRQSTVGPCGCGHPDCRVR